jgi:hypothetical protein
MKVAIVKTLKISSGEIVPAGTVFSEPFPEWLKREMGHNGSIVKVVDATPFAGEDLIDDPVVSLPLPHIEDLADPHVDSLPPLQFTNKKEVAKLKAKSALTRRLAK